jgi:hypothetical protein
MLLMRDWGVVVEVGTKIKEAVAESIAQDLSMSILQILQIESPTNHAAFWRFSGRGEEGG